MTWDVNPIKSEDFGSPFKEAIADFFAGAARDLPKPSRWFSSYTLQNSLTLPLSLDTGRLDGDNDGRINPYEMARVWAGFLWDLRERAELMEADLGVPSAGRHAPEKLQFEALARMPSRLRDFSVALDRILDADAATTGKQLSYDVMSSAARHGLKPSGVSRISVAEPDRFVVDLVNDPAVNFTLFSGENLNFRFELTAFPELLGLDSSVGDPRYFRFDCAPFACSMDPFRERIGWGDDGVPDTADDEFEYDNKNHKYSLTINETSFPGVIAGLAGSGTESRPLFYRLTTYTNDIPGLPGDQGSPPLSSDIPGAGTTWLHPDLPAVIVAPPAADPGCLVCAVGGGPATRNSLAPVLAGCTVLVVIVIRRRRAP